MKWSEMTPRERDALVAEKVMGWKEVGRHDFDGWDANENYGEVPHYTTDISAAWEVVDKLTRPEEVDDIPCDMNLSLDNGTSQYKQWRCSIFTSDDQFDGRAPTAPEAICLAALKAVGVDVE